MVNILENCLICQQDVTGSPGYCLHCKWPTGFNSKLRNSQIDAAVVNWSAGLYHEYLKLKSSPGKVTPPTVDHGGLEAKIQHLAQGLRELNDACIQERQYFDRKLSTISNELEFLKAQIPTSTNVIARINNLEEQHVKIRQNVAALQAQLDAPVPVVQSIAHIGALEGIAQVIAQPEPPAMMSLPESVVVATNEVTIELFPAEQELIKHYNRYEEIPENIRQGAVDVSLDSGALNRLRDGDVSNTSFVLDRKGNFLVVPRSGFQYLVPNKKRPINSHIHKTVKFIYTCQGYYEDYVQLLLVKPAIVREVGTAQWQLSQPGILQFK
jgi:hypothetical protein